MEKAPEDENLFNIIKNNKIINKIWKKPQKMKTY